MNLFFDNNVHGYKRKKILFKSTFNRKKAYMIALEKVHVQKN